MPAGYGGASQQVRRGRPVARCSLTLALRANESSGGELGNLSAPLMANFCMPIGNR